MKPLMYYLVFPIIAPIVWLMYQLERKEKKNHKLEG